MKYKRLKIIVALIAILATTLVFTACSGSNRVQSITAANFHETIASELPTLVYFYSPTCPFCQQQTPYLQELANNHPTFFRTVQMNVQNNPDELAIFHELGLRYVPSFVLFQSGEQVGTHFVGVHTVQQLITEVNNRLG